MEYLLNIIEYNMEYNPNPNPYHLLHVYLDHFKRISRYKWARALLVFI